MKRITLLLLALGLVLFAAACAEDAESPVLTESAYTPPPDSSTADAPLRGSSAASAVDPCSLLSASEVGGVIGDEVSQGLRTSTDTMVRCTWTPTSGTGGGVSAGIVTGNIESVLNEYRSAARNTEVTGLGDGAFYNEELQNLVVRRGQTVLVIDFDRPEEDAASKAEELARQMLTKL